MQLPGPWEWLLPEALKVALNIELSIILSRKVNLELIIELLKIQNITWKGIWYWKGLKWMWTKAEFCIQVKNVIETFIKKLNLRTILSNVGYGDAQCSSVNFPFSFLSSGGAGELPGF